MAMSLNRAQIIGNLTRDPEMRQIPGGQIVTTFSIATNFSWTDQSGQKQEKPEFHNVVAWRKLGEICGQYLKKGSKVFIEGRIQTRNWEAEDGTKRYRTEIVAENMIMLDKKGDVVPTEMQAPHAGIQQNEPAEAGAPSNAPTEEASTPSKGAPAEETVPAQSKEQKEEDVTIDDLPF